MGPLDNDSADALIRHAVDQWQAVPSSTVSFQEQPQLEVDVDADNILDFFGGAPIGGGEIRPENPVIFDNDGAVIDMLLGAGSRNSVLAFSGPRFINTNTRNFLSGFAVFNGLFALSENFQATVVHELGHLLGLDHTQANRLLASNQDAEDNWLVPLMYPFAIANAVEQPLRDDIAWISWLQPASSFQETGSISGNVTRRGGEPLRGANVVAVRLEPNDAESLHEVVSVVSGFLLDGSGDYLIPGLIPGRYVVFIEPLDPRFVGGSSVGPYDQRFDQFPKDYYNGINETGTNSDNPLAKTVLVVSGGQEIEGIDLVANEGNLPPTVEAGEPRTVQSAQLVQLEATAQDPDGDALEIRWSQQSGPQVVLSDPESLRPTFLAPATAEAVALVFRLTVDDGFFEASDTVRITVIPVPGNNPPLVDAGPDQVAAHGQLVELQGQTSDPDGDSLFLRWRQLTGPAVELLGADQQMARFVAPSVSERRVLTFQLEASDGKGGFAQDRSNVTLLRNRPPQVEVAPFTTVPPGELVELQAEAEDPDGDPLTFRWEQTSGSPLDLEGEDSDRLVFRAPAEAVNTFFGFQLEVSDGGLTATAAVAVLVGGSAPIVMPASLRLGDERLRRSFVGGAVIHDSADDVSVFLRVRDLQGDLVEADTDLQLAAGGQWTFLTEQLTRGQILGTLSLQGVEEALKGFFLMGDLEATRLDGVGGQLEIAPKLYLQAVRRNATVDTLVYLHNPDPSGDCLLTLRLRGPDGGLKAESQTLLAPGGTLLQMLGSLFELDEDSEEEGYVVVEGSRPLLGMAMLVDDEAYVALPAVAPRSTLRLYAPHFFTDGDRQTTRLRLLNAGERSIQVRITAYDDQSNVLGTFQQVVEAGTVLDQAVFSFLEDPSPGVITVGYLEVLANEGLSGPLLIPAQLVGSAIFSTNRGRARSSLPLAEEPAERYRFLHVAQSGQAHVFQGLALLNTNGSAAQVTLQAFDAEGEKTAENTFTLEPGHRIVDLLDAETYFGENFDQTGGHLRLQSSLPIYTFSLFTDGSQTFLSAVQGQPLR
ncbi:MAG TPA: hypothetical protein VLU25_13530 [Acidobacteriota bacterium]|nr:hypothetical protein [Acidobacteriota bacterium]